MDAEAALWARGKGLEVGEGVVGVEEALSLPSPWAETSREGGSMEAGGGRPWLVWWQHRKAWRRPEAGAKERGKQGGSNPVLTLGRGALWRQLHGRRQRPAV